MEQNFYLVHEKENRVVRRNLALLTLNKTDKTMVLLWFNWKEMENFFSLNDLLILLALLIIKYLATALYTWWKYRCRFNYLQILQPISGTPLASIGKLPFFGKLPIEAKGIPNIGWRICWYVVEMTLPSIVFTDNYITVHLPLKFLIFLYFLGFHSCLLE